jgi:hypothetical protein
MGGVSATCATCGGADLWMSSLVVFWVVCAAAVIDPKAKTQTGKMKNVRTADIS